MKALPLHADLTDLAVLTLYFPDADQWPADLAARVGTTVRFTDWEPSMGTVTRDCTFLVGSVQRLYDGSWGLRVYSVENGDTFGRAARSEEVEKV
mgnify:CR=1 FL=1|tara:strand:- start:21807 stop:22091 length:285 start_codon:yes stop_codon:yes gene_type:complete